MAVSELGQASGRVLALSPSAEREGIQVGDRLARARSLCPQLEILPPDPDLSRRAEEEILQCLSQLSPWLDSDRRGAFFLGLSGLENLVPDERAWMRRVEEALFALGFNAQLCAAERPIVAWLIARRAAAAWKPPARLPPIAVAPSEEGDTLSSLSIHQLGLSEKAVAFLELLGLQTAQDLAGLPPGALGRRLGPEGRWIEELCHGKGQALKLSAKPVWPSAANAPILAEEAAIELELPTEAWEAVLFLCKSLVDRLLRQVGARNLALCELSIQARLDDRSTLRHVLRPAEPTLDSAKVLGLVRLWLESKPFASPVCALKVIATGTALASAKQLNLFHQGEERQAAALEQALARLIAAFGSQSVVRAELIDTFKPEDRLNWETADPTRFDSPKPKTQALGLPFVLRWVNPPQPLTLSSDGELFRAGHPTGRLKAISRPHRLTGQWWEKGGFDRSYSWLTTSDDELWWVFRDEEKGGLYVQAEVD